MVNKRRRQLYSMDCHDQKKLTRKSLFTSRKREFCCPLINLYFGKFREIALGDRGEGKFWTHTFFKEIFHFEDSVLETENVGSSLGDSYGGCSFLPGSASPT